MMKPSYVGLTVLGLSRASALARSVSCGTARQGCIRGDGAAPDVSRLPPPGGASVGAVGAEATALLQATRPASVQHGAADLLEGDRAMPAIQQPRGGAAEQGGAARRRGRFHPPLWLQPERTCALSRLCGQWGV